MATYSDKIIGQYLLSLGIDLNEAQLTTELKKMAAMTLKAEEELSAASTALERRTATAKLKANRKLLNDLTVERLRYLKNAQKAELAVNQDTLNKKSAQNKTFFTKQSAQLASFARYTVGSFAITGIIAIFASLTKELFKVEVELAKVAALTGATNKELNQIRATVYDISTSFNIASSEVAKFALEMAKLGKSAKEIDTLAKQAATLSAVLGTDMADAGRLIVTTMNQFNIAVEDADRVTSAFIKTIGESPLTVDQLRTALQYVGTAASAARVSLEDISSIMSLLSNRGLRASKIGTGLRNVLLTLSDSGENFYDIMEKMSQEGLTLAEALEQFGKRGATAAYILVNEWEEVSDTFGNDVPTSIENTAAAMTSLATASAFWGRIWRDIGAGWTYFWTGIGLDRDEELELVEDLSVSLGRLGISMKEYSDTAVKVLNDLPDATLDQMQQEIFNRLFSSQTEIDPDSPQDSDLLKNMRSYNIILIDQKETQKEQAKLVKEVSNTGKAVLQSVIDGQKDRQVLLDKIKDGSLRDELFNSIESSLAAPEVYRIIDQELKQLNIDLTTLDLRTLPELDARIKNIDGQIAEIKASGRGDVYSLEQAKRLGAEREDLLELVCGLRALYGMEELQECKDKKSRSAAKAIDNTSKEFRLLREKLETSRLDALALINTMANLLRDEKLSLDQYGKDLETLITEGDVSPEDAVELLRVKFAEASDAVKKLASEQRQFSIFSIGLEEASYEKELAGLEEKLARLMGLPPTPELEREISKVEGDILTTLGKIEDTKQKVSKEVERIDNKEESALDALSKQELTITEKLLGSSEQNELELLDILQIIEEGLNQIADLYNQFAEEQLNQKLDALEAEREILEARNAQEQEYLDAQLADAIISQEQYNAENERLRKKAIDDENAIGKAEFEAQKKRDKEALIIETILGAVMAFIQSVSSYPPPAGPIIGAAMAALVVAQGAVGLNAIGKRQFIPKKYAEGGLVEGPSHAEGGVPFTVQGRGGYEMEGGEYVFDKGTTAKYLPMFEMLRGNKHYDPTHFQTGGMIQQQSQSEAADLRAELKNTYIRAYITDKDLKENDDRTSTMKQRTDLW